MGIPILVGQHVFIESDPVQLYQQDNDMLYFDGLAQDCGNSGAFSNRLIAVLC